MKHTQNYFLLGRDAVSLGNTTTVSNQKAKPGASQDKIQMKPTQIQFKQGHSLLDSKVEHTKANINKVNAGASRNNDSSLLTTTNEDDRKA